MTFPAGANTDGQGQAFLMGNPEVWNMPAPASYSTTATYLTSDIVGGIIVNGNAGAITSTLPTAALLVAALRTIFAMQLAIGDTIGCLIVNGGSGVITLAAGTGGSYDTNQTAGQSIAVGASKYVMLRLTNITIGSEAYTIYS